MGQQQLSVHDDAPSKITKTIQVSGATGAGTAPDALSVPDAGGPNRPQLPEATDIHPPPDALSAFVQAIEAARYPSPRLPGWWLASATRKFDGLCAYCGQDAGSAPDVDAVIPVVAGGPQRPDATVLTCKACRQGRGRRDLLLWKPNVSPKLRAMRAALALDSWNHLSRDPADMKTPAKASDVITARWQQPRFHCHGALLSTGGFIGWREAAQVPSAMQLRLVFDHSAWRLRQSMKNAHRRNNTPTVFWVPTRQGALDALWDVIEHNGLVRRVDLGDLSSPIHEAQPDFSSDWAMVFPTVADLVRRRWRRPQ
jgi:hypothetical protein